MFETLTVKELKLLIRELRDHHTIKRSSKMKKPELVAQLSDRFILRDGNLYLKEDARPMKEPKIEPKHELKPKKLKEMTPIPRNAGVVIGKNKYAFTRPIR
jgi:hypothetical protein